MAEIEVVTTCNLAQWRSYGLTMAESFTRFWPREAQLVVYGDTYFPCPPFVTWRRMPSWFVNWKASHEGNPDAHGMGSGTYKFRRDCIKFSHKVAALTDAGLTTEADLLIWADIDTVTDKPVTLDWLEALFPTAGLCRIDTPCMAWLDRADNYPECGFMMFRTPHLAFRELMKTLSWVYESNRVLELRQTHDSFVIQQVVNQFVRENRMAEPHSLSGAHRNKHHPFVHGPLGERMDHMKGNRKHLGRSLERRERR